VGVTPTTIDSSQALRATPALRAGAIHKHLGKGAARVHVLRGLDLSVQRGEFIAVMGPSGCGKSTLLHVLGLMTHPDRGELTIDDKDVAADTAARDFARRTQVGFVFQRFNLLGVLSARDNVAISLKVRGLQYGPATDELFEKLGVADLSRRKPAQMSIGQQQRIALVRAIAHKPLLLLADEPTGNLDSENAHALLELLRTLNRGGQTIIMITHSAEAATYASRVVRMKDGRLGH
jgi:putative ABC transport system ATP-binding protein